MSIKITKTVSIYKILSLFFLFTVISCSSNSSHKGGDPRNPTPSYPTPSYPGLEKLLLKAADKADLEALFPTHELKQCISDLVQKNAHLNNLLDTYVPGRNDDISMYDNSYLIALCDYREGLRFIKDTRNDRIYISAFDDSDKGVMYCIFYEAGTWQAFFSNVLTIENFREITHITGFDIGKFKAIEARFLPVIILLYSGFIENPTAANFEEPKILTCKVGREKIFVVVTKDGGGYKKLKLDTWELDWQFPGTAWKSF